MQRELHRMTRHFTIPAIISLTFVLVLIHMPLTAGAPPLTDRQKKETIRKIYLDIQKKFSTVADISADEALELAEQQQVVFVDTRKPAEQAVSMLPNAVTREMLLKDPTLIQGKTAVVYCTIGYRSGVLAEKLARQGIHLKNLAGGILSWVHAGGKVYDDQGETHGIHVYGKRWDYAPRGYETVLFGLFDQILNLK